MKPQEAWELAATSGWVVFLDVRSPEEYGDKPGHVPGSVCVPLHTLPEKISCLTPYKSHCVIVMCKSGCRSGTASRLLQARGFCRVHNLEGGVQKWLECGLPLECEPSETKK